MQAFFAVSWTERSNSNCMGRCKHKCSQNQEQGSQQESRWDFYISLFCPCSQSLTPFPQILTRIMVVPHGISWISRLPRLFRRGGCDHPILESQNCIDCKKPLRTLNSTNPALPNPRLNHVTKSTYLLNVLNTSINLLRMETKLRLQKLPKLWLFLISCLPLWPKALEE